MSFPVLKTIFLHFSGSCHWFSSIFCACTIFLVKMTRTIRFYGKFPIKYHFSDIFSAQNQAWTAKTEYFSQNSNTNQKKLKSLQKFEISVLRSENLDLAFFVVLDRCAKFVPNRRPTSGMDGIFDVE